MFLLSRQANKVVKDYINLEGIIMKKLLSMVVAVMLVLTMTISVSAVYNGSVYQDRIPEFTSATATAADGSSVPVYSWEVVITPEDIASIGDASSKVAFDEVKNSKDLTKLVPELADKLPAGVGPEDLTVRDVFEVSAYGNAAKILDNGGSITVTFKVKGITANDTDYVLHKGSNGWEVVPSTVSWDGTVTATFTSLSPVAIVTLKTTAVNPNGPTSPATGEADAASDTVYVASMLLA